VVLDVPYLSDEKIRATADYVREITGFDKQFPVDPSLIAGGLGVRFEFVSPFEMDISGNASGMIRRDPANDTYTIYVNRFEQAERQRFTGAHELGHYVLHFLNPVLRETLALEFRDNDNTLYRTESARLSGEMRRLEIQANMFAAEFLMPERKFAEVLREPGGILRAPSVFGVSAQATYVRYSVLKQRGVVPK